MSEDLHVVRPDNRGRLALRQLIDRERSYSATRHPDGSVVLTPIAHVMSDEAYNDFQADPAGYASMIDRARAIVDGAPSVTVDEFWRAVDEPDTSA